MSGDRTKGRNPIYAASLKVAAARDYLSSALSYKSIAEKYGIEKPSSIRGFVKWYKKKYPEGMNEYLPVEQAAEVPVKDAALSQANLKIAALEMLIENASKELGIDLVKKFGTKQSVK